MKDEQRTGTTREIDPLLSRRHSPLAFDPDRDLSEEQLATLFEAARWAPSCFNDQPWRFVFWQRSRHAAEYGNALACLVEGNRSWAHRAPVLVASLADSQFRSGGENRWGPFDAGASSVYLCLQAAAMGLVTHPMGGFDERRLAEILELPDRFEPMAMIAVGYAGDPALLEEKQAARQAAPRQRRPLREIVFDSTWGATVGW